MGHNVNGQVGLEALVLEDGTVGPVHVTRPLDPELDQAAVVALRQWRFIPATIGDRAVKHVVEIEMTFTVK
jgi:TonB family protein